MTKEFKVINTPRHDRFEESITKLLSDNWELHGSPFVSQTGGMTQALVREVKAQFKQPAKTKAKTNEVS